MTTTTTPAPPKAAAKLIAALIKEVKEQAATTRKFMELVPENNYDWQPHEKSMKLINLARHIAELPEWIHMTITTEKLDFNDNPYTPAEVTKNSDLMAIYDRCLAKGLEALDQVEEAELDKNWTLCAGENIYSVSPKSEVIRMSINQIVHHRAQLGVYFRLLGIPVPPSFGPTADHPEF